MNHAELIRPGNTPLTDCHGLFGVAKLFMKDETNNPTHTFKDRLGYEMLQPVLESVSRGEVPERITFGAISYGNTAYSMGFFCKRVNEIYGQEIVKAIAFVPPTIVHRSFGPDTEGNMVSWKNVVRRLQAVCDLIEINLEAQVYTEHNLKQIAEDHGVLNGRFIDVTEGLDRPAYREVVSEVIENNLKRAPDYVIAPFGAGILCNEIIDYVQDNHLATKVIPVSSGNLHTIAVMLYGPIWVNTKELVRNGYALSRHTNVDRKGRVRHPYVVYNVKDDEILQAMKILKENHIVAEPSGAAGFAILHRLAQIDQEFRPDKHTVVVVNTGDGILNFI